MDKKEKLILFGILIAAFLLRLIAINQSLWLDEGIMAYAVSKFSLKALLTTYMPGDFNPPLYFILLWGWSKIFGISEIALRMPSVLLGVLTVFVAIIFQRKIAKPKDNKSWIWIGLLLLSAPLLIYYSQEARMYALSAFTSLLSMYYFYRHFVLKEKVYPAYVLTTIAMFWSHYLAWFIFPVQIIFYLLQEKDKWQKSIIKFIMPVLGIIPIIPILLAQINAALSSANSLPAWKALSSFSLKQLALIPIKIVSGRIAFDQNAITELFIILALGFYLVIIIKPYIKLANDSFALRFKIESSQKLILLWALLPVFIGAILSVKMALFSYFRFLYIAPAFYLATVNGLLSFKNRSASKMFFLIFSFNFIFSSFYLLNSNNHREDWRSLVNYIKSRNLSNQIVILDAVARPFWYYDRDSLQLIDYSQIEKLGGSDGVWLIKYAQPIFDPDNIIESKMLTDYGFEALEEKHFRGDLVIKYLIRSQKPLAYDYWY